MSIKKYVKQLCEQNDSKENNDEPMWKKMMKKINKDPNKSKTSILGVRG